MRTFISQNYRIPLFWITVKIFHSVTHSKLSELEVEFLLNTLCFPFFIALALSFLLLKIEPWEIQAFGTHEKSSIQTHFHTRIHKRKYIYMFINSIICLFCRNGKENAQNIRIDVNFPRSCSIDFDTYSMNFHKCLWQFWRKKTLLNLYAYRSFVRFVHIVNQKWEMAMVRP